MQTNFFSGGGGDFNFYFDLGLEADGGKPNIKLMSLAKFESIKQKHDFSDVWRIRNPTVDDLLTAQNPHFFAAGSTIFPFLIVVKKTLSRSISLRL